MKYYFHIDKHAGFLKTRYVMEDANRAEVYCTNAVKPSMLKPRQFEFTNKQTGKTVQLAVSNPKIYGADYVNVEGRKKRIYSHNHVQINGQNCWDMLHASGYDFQAFAEGTRIYFQMFRDGQVVGAIVQTGTNVYADEPKGLNRLPISGYYQIECEPDEMDMAFMLCFMITESSFTDQGDHDTNRDTFND